MGRGFESLRAGQQRASALPRKRARLWHISPMPASLTSSNNASKWAALCLLSLVFAGLFSFFHLPAAILLGCMLAAVWLSTREWKLQVPATASVLAQGVLGCLIARSLRLSVLHRISSDWPLFLAITVAVVLASALLGWVLMRRQLLPGTTAVWGLAPGAASVMVLMAEAYGADVRLVAIMQYLRVVMVTVVASLVSRLWISHTAAPLPQPDWLLLGPTPALLETLALALGGALLARRLRIPAGPLLLTMGLGALLQGLGWLNITLPALLLAAAYMVIGWSFGLRFTRGILVHAWRVLPRVMAAILVLIVFCMLLAAALTWLMGLDPLTAYLATSPGGADSVAIIAAGSSVDVGFVMAMQMVRFSMVLLFGPQVFRQIAERLKPAPST